MTEHFFYRFGVYRNAFFASLGYKLSRFSAKRGYRTLKAPYAGFSCIKIYKRIYGAVCNFKGPAVKAVPLILNEILWNVGMNVYFWSYARLDETALPAVTIGEQISTIAAVLAMGTSSAVSVLIGAELGAGRLSQAKANCKKLLTLVVAIGLVCVALCLGLGAILPNAFGVEPRLRDLAARIATVMGVFSPFNFLYGFCFYCMRAGGDTRSAMLLDSGYMWLVPVPASLLMALLLPGRIDIAAAVLVVQVLMNLKVIPALWVLKRGKWVRNITVEGSQV